jgi:hypothetical protein
MKSLAPKEMASSSCGSTVQTMIGVPLVAGWLCN